MHRNAYSREKSRNVFLSRSAPLNAKKAAPVSRSGQFVGRRQSERKHTPAQGIRGGTGFWLREMGATQLLSWMTFRLTTSGFRAYWNFQDCLIE